MSEPNPPNRPKSQDSQNTQNTQNSQNSQNSGLSDCIRSCLNRNHGAGGVGNNQDTPPEQGNQDVRMQQPGVQDASAVSPAVVPPAAAQPAAAQPAPLAQARGPSNFVLVGPRIIPKSPQSASNCLLEPQLTRDVPAEQREKLAEESTISNDSSAENSSSPIPGTSGTSNNLAPLPASTQEPSSRESTPQPPQEPPASSDGTAEEQKSQDGGHLEQEEPREAKPGEDEEPIETRCEEHEQLRSPVRLPRGVETLDEVPKLKEMIRSKEYDLTHPFWDKISIFYGDITKIQVDAIVNAANSGLYGGGGVDGAIHSAAGERLLKAETKKCERPVATGDAVITPSCNLSTHVKNIIHCVGPSCYGAVTQSKREQLVSCYRRAFELSEEHELRSIAFCCISTGIYGYDNFDAAKSVIKFLYKYFSKAENVEKWDRVVLCLFMDIDKECYKRVITSLLKNNTIFDKEETKSEDEDDDEEKDEKKKIKKEEEDEDDNMEEEEGSEEKKKDDKTDEKDKKDDEKDGEESKKEDGNKCDKTEESGNNEKKEGDASETEKDTVDGEEQKKEEAVAPSSSSNTSTPEEKKLVEEEEGEKREDEKENSEVDGATKSDDDVTSLKRALSEEKEGDLPAKRDKIERESAV